jgi:hypothetical protein
MCSMPCWRTRPQNFAVINPIAVRIAAIGWRFPFHADGVRFTMKLSALHQRTAKTAQPDCSGITSTSQPRPASR